jgi:hypothetical protein
MPQQVSRTATDVICYMCEIHNAVNHSGLRVDQKRMPVVRHAGVKG